MASALERSECCIRKCISEEPLVPSFLMGSMGSAGILYSGMHGCEPVFTHILTGMALFRNPTSLESQPHKEGGRFFKSEWSVPSSEEKRVARYCICLMGMSNVSLSGEHFMVAPCLHRRSLPIRDSVGCGQTVKEWSKDGSYLYSHLIGEFHSYDMPPPNDIVFCSWYHGFFKWGLRD